MPKRPYQTRAANSQTAAWMSAILLAATLLLSTPLSPVYAQSEAPAQARLPIGDAGDDLPPDADAILRSPRFRQLAHELRCLVCQNQTLLDSHAPLAIDLRHEVVRQIASGKNDEQVKQYLVDRYGEFVLYRPGWSWRTALLWAGPLLMLLIGGLILWRTMARRPQGAAPVADPSGTEASAPGSATSGASSTQNDALRQVDALLADEPEKPGRRP